MSGGEQLPAAAGGSPASALRAAVGGDGCPAPAAAAARGSGQSARRAAAGAEGRKPRKRQKAGGGGGGNIEGGGFDSRGFAAAVASELARHGGLMEAGLLLHTVPSLRRRLSGRKLLQVLRLYPEHFQLNEVSAEGWEIRLLRPFEGTEAEAAAADTTDRPRGEHAAQALEQALIRGIVYYCERYDGTDRGEVTSAPLRWLFAHRRVSQALRAFEVACPRVDYAYHVEPEKHGYATRRDAYGAALCAHLCDFLDARPHIFRCHTDSEGRRHAGLQDGVRPQPKATRPARQPGRDASSSPAASSSMSAAELTALSGAWVLVTRATARTRQLHALELQLRAQWAAMAPQELREVRAGVWAVAEGAPGAENFLRSVAGSPCLRRIGRLLAAAPVCEASAFTAAAAAAARELRKPAAGARELGRWRLAYDFNFPCADADSALPFVDVSAQAAVAARVVAAVGADGLDDAADRCIAVAHTRDLLLLIDCGSIPPGGTDWHRWRARWGERSFSFNASLDAGVAAASAAAAAAAHAVWHREQSASGPPSGGPLPLPDLCVDACCGSGTLAAAAAQLGVPRVVGCELRSDFAERARGNLAECGMSGVEVLHQDVTQPLPESVGPPGMVLCNPPWGRRFGTEEDCLRVLRGVSDLAPADATICIVAPKRAIDLATGGRGGASLLRSRHRVPLGAVEVLIGHRAPRPAG
eukprot:TRINITY_DN27871_c0_g3_i1.p1 TRINITY_DN27871_c0_g3~~TRINITY_DN27871_c0_g3_i1.p1  ORF type:complete len:734 (+),score=153.77 TRINITY_DN27871_c0_g3_i1:108-2204(+)